MSRWDRTKNPDSVPFYRDIHEAFGQPGCPFCRLLAHSADRYLDAVLWEMVNDPEVRAEFNQARGYCARHGWLLLRAGAALGVAIMTRGLLGVLLDAVASNPLEEASESTVQSWLRSLDRDRVSPATDKLAASLSPQVPCPLCAQVEYLEQEYAKTLLAHLEGTGALVEIYGTSDGLCLHHFRQALSHAPAARQARVLVDAQRAVWQRLYDELGEFIRKKDYRFRDESFGPEKDAWRRALEAISGPPPRSVAAWQALVASQPETEPGPDGASLDAPPSG